MEDTTKYLIHATIAADGVVERSDVVGAVFGQTEGLLGDELDLRDLQQSSKVGRIDVAIESENGQSFGEITIASSLDKVETAILAAALETITRVGPCRASVEVTNIEDVRAAKRREVVERAKELLADSFRETALSSDEVLEEVRESTRVEGIADYEGLPAGPRVADSDAVIVVEGRSDVLTLLECGIKNAVAVEGTNVPDAVADLTRDRTVTAFLDGDRGGELILRELAQVGEVDYVAFAPAGRSVEDLDRSAVLEALRGKVPYETLADEPNLREAAGEPPGGASQAESRTEESDAEPGPEPDDSPTTEAVAGSVENGSAEAVDTAETPADGTTRDGIDDASDDAEQSDGSSDADTSNASDDAEQSDSSGDTDATGADAAGADSAVADADPETASEEEPGSVRTHVRQVIDDDTGLARLLAEDGSVVDDVDAGDAFEAIESAPSAPNAVVVDGEITQRLLDVAAQRGVSQLFGRSTGEFVKQPIGTRVRTADELRTEA